MQHGSCCARRFARGVFWNTSHVTFGGLATWPMLRSKVLQLRDTLRLQRETCCNGRNIGNVATATWAMFATATGDKLQHPQHWRCCDCNMGGVVWRPMQLGRCCDRTMVHVATIAMLKMLCGDDCLQRPPSCKPPKRNKGYVASDEYNKSHVANSGLAKMANAAQIGRLSCAASNSSGGIRSSAEQRIVCAKNNIDDPTSNIVCPFVVAQTGLATSHARLLYSRPVL